jgi:hypothetical protein
VAPHQLRHAHAVELLHEGIPLPLIQRQLGHSHLSTTGTYLQGIAVRLLLTVQGDGHLHADPRVRSRCRRAVARRHLGCDTIQVSKPRCRSRLERSSRRTTPSRRRSNAEVMAQSRRRSRRRSPPRVRARRSPRRSPHR